MVQFGPKLDLDEARKRAAEIRSEWTLSERSRRAGLPPDLPFMLRNLLCVESLRPLLAVATHANPKS
jgi:hypothetical protein